MVYQYSGVDNKGKNTKGTIEGSSKEEVIKQLKQKGIYTLEIKEIKKGILYKDIQIFSPVKSGDLLVFTRQLATLIKAGVTILDSINILSKQSENKKFSQILIDIEKEIRGGASLSDAFSLYPKVFPVLFINMVKAGELSGNLDNTLNSAAVYLEKENITRKKIKSALTYPIVVMVLAVAVTIFLLIKVVPSFVDLYATFDAELPLPTRIVLFASHFVLNYWIVLLVLFLVIIFLYNFLNNNTHTKYHLDYLKLKMPIFGKLLQKSAIARFSRTLSLLLVSAVPILDSLLMVSNIVDNEAFARPIRESRDSLSQGKPLHKPLESNKIFPPLLIHMMAIGEETGSLEEMLDKVADFYESDVESMTDQLKQLIEPLMIVFLTAIVGVIVLAVLMPMFGLYDLIGQ
ncbi:MAG: type II secretion system F family protein [Vulcanibacillus sp.]